MNDRSPASFDLTGFAICVVLALGVVVVFCQTGRHEFVNFDDDRYVYDNPHVKPGLTLDDLGYYVVHRHSYMYHPLTTLTHLLDCQMFGVDAGKHHWMNVVFHSATAIGLFLVLRLMTGRLWPAALVAALFAVHPLRVESVAWISERRDVLSGLLLVLTMWAYVRYARDPRAPRRYATVCVFFALGLMAKPMLVTVPALLLLLDFWPLKRRETIQQLLSEKIPLVVISLVACVITVYTQGDGGAVQTLESVSWRSRIANTPIAYANYVGCFFWPQNLAVLYPHPCDNFDGRDAIVKACALAAGTAGVLLLGRRMRYLLVGWLWYLGMLMPVIGLLQVGGASMADRYTYLPQIGLAIAVVWTVTAAVDWLNRSRGEEEPGAALGQASFEREPKTAARFHGILALVCAAALAALAIAAWRQTAYWRNSETLWARELSFPQYNNVTARYDYGLALAEAGRHREAVAQFEAGLAIDPKDEASRLELGLSYEAIGSADVAMRQYRTLVADNAKSASGHSNLARLLHAQGDDRQAVEHYRIAHKEEPANSGTCVQLANLLATSPDGSLRDGAQALRLAKKAVELSKGEDAAALDARATAEAESGNFASAMDTAQAALKLAEAGGDKKLAAEIRDRLELYRRGRPYHAAAIKKSQARNPISEEKVKSRH